MTKGDTLTPQFRPVGEFYLYGRGGVVHWLHFPAPDDVTLVVLLVHEHKTLATALRHARHLRARPAHQRHVRVRDRRFGGGGGRVGQAAPVLDGRRRSGGGRSGRRVVVVVVRRDPVHQWHAVDAVIGASERQPLRSTDRPVFLSEHDQPPVVQHSHVLVDDGHVPGAHFARHVAVHVEGTEVRFELVGQIWSLQELHVWWYPPAEAYKSDLSFSFKYSQAYPKYWIFELYCTKY